MQIDRLYREIEFPVSRGTPMISPLIEYDHEKNWNVPNLNAKTSVSFERKVTIDLSAEDEYLIGHVINGIVLKSKITMIKFNFFRMISCYFVHFRPLFDAGHNVHVSRVGNIDSNVIRTRYFFV